MLLAETEENSRRNLNYEEVYLRCCRGARVGALRAGGGFRRPFPVVADGDRLPRRVRITPTAMPTVRATGMRMVRAPATLMPTAMASATTTKTARALGMWMPTATAYATTAPVLERTARATWMPTVMASATTTAAGTAMVMAMAVTMAAVTAALAKQTLRVREICP